MAILIHSPPTRNSCQAGIWRFYAKMNVIKNFLLQKLSPDFCKLGFFIVVFIKLKVVMRVAGVEGNV